MPSASTSTSTSTSNNSATSNHNNIIIIGTDPPPPTANNAASSSSSSRAPPSQPNTACAACKYQRRKCKLDCILAPFFPADQQRQFLNAHRLFGVSNILKIIRDLDPIQRDQAMNTIILQSNMRAQDPVGGCHRLIRELEREIERETAELEIIMQHLAICRAQAAAGDLSSPNVDLNSEMVVNLSDGHSHYTVVPEQQQYLNYLFDDPGASTSNSHSIDNMNGNEEEILVRQQRCEEEIDRQQQPCEEESYHDVKPVVQSQHSNNLERREGNQPILIDNVQEHDLKRAASLLTLI